MTFVRPFIFQAGFSQEPEAPPLNPLPGSDFSTVSGAGDVPARLRGPVVVICPGPPRGKTWDAL